MKLFRNTLELLILRCGVLFTRAETGDVQICLFFKNVVKYKLNPPPFLSHEL